MPLIACPDCGHRVSDAAPACIQCGRPLTALAPATPRAPAPAPAPAESAYVCRRCGSADVKKLSIVYAAGVSTVNLSGTGFAYGDQGHDGFVSLSGTGTQQTSLSKATAPPEPRTISKKPVLVGGGIAGAAFLLGWIMDAFGVFELGLIAAIVVGGFLAWEEKQDNDEWNDSELPALRAKWDRSAICLRCGMQFELEPSPR